MELSRRSVVMGLGGLIAGAGAVLGTGAFTTVEAERTVSVETAGDANAFLAITPGSEGDQYVEANGTVEIDITDTNAGGQGVNQNATTAIDQLLEVTNNGTQDVAVGFDNEYAIQQGDYNSTGQEYPGGWGYAVADSEWAAAVWASPLPAELNDPLAEIRPQLVTTGFDGSTLVSGNSIHNEVRLSSERTISPGESLNIGIIVDTRNSTLGTIPGDLDDTVSLYAETAGN
jgi:hypothetical protein